MSTEKNSPEAIMAQAQALIDQIQSDLNARDDFYRSQGLDPEQVRAALEAQLTPQLREEAQKAFAADMEAVEQEVREEMARNAFAEPAKRPSAVRRPRPMV